MKTQTKPSPQRSRDPHSGFVVASLLCADADIHYGHTLRPVGGISAMKEALQSGKKVKWKWTTTKKERAELAKKPFRVCGASFNSRKAAYAAFIKFGKVYEDRIFSPGPKSEKEIAKALQKIVQNRKTN